MPGRRRSRRSLQATLAIVVLYGAVLLLGPALHHDFACHQSSRTHCLSCLSSPSAPNQDVHGIPVDQLHRVAERIEMLASVHVQTPALSALSDRSPPA